MGKYWGQPKGLRDVVELFDTHAMLPETVFFCLPNYERTTPSGVYPGKVWRQGRKWLCWYGPEKKRGGKAFCRCVCLRVLLT